MNVRVVIPVAVTTAKGIDDKKKYCPNLYGEWLITKILTRDKCSPI